MDDPLSFNMRFWYSIKNIAEKHTLYKDNYLIVDFDRSDTGQVYYSVNIYGEIRFIISDSMLKDTYASYDKVILRVLKITNFPEEDVEYVVLKMYEKYYYSRFQIKSTRYYRYKILEHDFAKILRVVHCYENLLKGIDCPIDISPTALHYFEQAKYSKQIISSVVTMMCIWKYCKNSINILPRDVMNIILTKISNIDLHESESGSESESE